LKSGISGEWPVMAQPDMKSAVHTGTTVTWHFVNLIVFYVHLLQT
jgi:hypothetical protein